MSVRKKIISILLLIITAFAIWLLFWPDDKPEPDFSSANKIELLASILAGNNEDIIRDAGYGIPDDSVIRRWGINELKIPGKLNLDVRPPTSLEDSELLVLFSTMINGKETDAGFFVDKELKLTYSRYTYIDKDAIRKKIEIDETQEKELLHQVQTELNQFFEKMKQQLASK